MPIYEPFPQAWKQAEWFPQSHAEEPAVKWDDLGDEVHLGLKEVFHSHVLDT